MACFILTEWQKKEGGFASETGEELASLLFFFSQGVDFFLNTKQNSCFVCQGIKLRT